MNRIFAFLMATMAAAATAAACAPTEAGRLTTNGYGDDDDDVVQGGQSTTPGSSGEPGTPGGVPSSGPGSAASVARKNFIDNVHPALNTACGSCHTAGTAGAPKFWAADPGAAYQLLDARGMVIGVGSLFVTHRHTGAGAEFNADQSGKVNAWLALEAKERVGQKAPEDIMAKLGQCINAADWKAAEAAINTMRTRQRNGENANTCTGCQNEICMACHNPGYGFAVGTRNETLSTTLVRERPFINRFFGTNGTEPVASNAIKAKADAVNGGEPYSHPNFIMSPQVEAAIADFVNKTIAAYKAGTCGGAAPTTTPTPGTN